MNPRRLAKASQAIKEVVGTAILTELRDPRVKNVTVLSADMAPDMRTAKVRISVLGDAKVEALCLKGLESARGFLQSKIADRLDVRYTPLLRFEVDRGVKRSIEASRILRDELGPPADPAELRFGPADDAALGAESGEEE